jgi:hypothetical protein
MLCLPAEQNDANCMELANTSWLRVAIQLAMVENVHLYDQKSNHTLQERNARKRLWWYEASSIVPQTR